MTATSMSSKVPTDKKKKKKGGGKKRKKDYPEVHTCMLLARCANQYVKKGDVKK